MSYIFEFSKPGYYKRFVLLNEQETDLRYRLTELAVTLNCHLVQVPDLFIVQKVHYVLPEDAAMFFLEVPTYYLNPETEGRHMLGRLTEPF